MNYSTHSLRRLHGFLMCLGGILSALWLGAQTASTGTIAGRVFNPVTGEYVRNAEVRVEGTNRAVVSENGGYYQITGVPAGEMTVSVNYTGYEKTSIVVNVEAGQTMRRDIELQGTSDTIRLATFVVSSEREGNAKAIMDQRNSMTMSTVVASDTFGFVTQGNVGEFMKYLPGVDIEYFESDAKGVRLGGMDPQYAGVSMDGMKLASADAFLARVGTDNVPAGEANRSVGFDQISINSIESIEVHRITPADLDADAPAGTINLKTKRAFDRKGRRIQWRIGGVLNSEEFHLRRTPGPSDELTRKVRPNVSLDYSDTFLDNRLGILVGISEANLYNEHLQIRHNFNYQTTAADPRPVVIPLVQFRDGPSWNRLFTASFTADYKATPELVFSLSATHNYNHRNMRTRTVNLQATTNNTNAATGRQFVSGDGITTFGTGGAAATARMLSLGYQMVEKITPSYTIIPKFEYRRDRLAIDGTFSYSQAKNDYHQFARGKVSGAGVDPIRDIGFTATRPNAASSAWTVVQTSGPSWANLASYLNPRASEDGKNVTNRIYNASVNAKYDLPLRNPTFVKVGAKVQERYLDAQQPGTVERTQLFYVGPGGGPTGSYAAFASPFAFDLGSLGVSFPTGAPVHVNQEEVGALLAAHPEFFDNNFLPGDLPKIYQRHRNITERIPSTYLMANTRVGKWQFQGGLRWERTETNSHEFDPLPASEVAAAGFPVANTGYAITQEGSDYQFLTRPMINRRGQYDNYFPSFTAKYRLHERLIADVGYGKGILRPNINHITGLWEYNELTERINVPNPNLKPEHSERFAAGMGYYFGAMSSLTLALTETHIENLAIVTDQTGAEFGITDPVYADYTVITRESGTGKRRFRGMELSYRHQLTFLPGILKGTSVFATYTRTYADVRRPGVVPHLVTGGVDYGYKRFNIGVRGVWQDDTPWSSDIRRYRKNNVKLDGQLGVKLTQRTSFFIQARNMFNDATEIFENDLLWRSEKFGSVWNIGVRGEF